MPPPNGRSLWSTDRDGTLLARNVVTDYVAIAIDIGIGILMLPFNIAHLGQAAYGLWVLTTSVTTYFSMLDLGYGSAQVKFAAQYRALRDAEALNEITSTLFFLFTGIALAIYGVAIAVAYNLGWIFNLGPAQAETAKAILLIISVHIALGLPFSVFGGVTNGFQRFYLNTSISIVTSLIVAAATVVVLRSGYGLLELVAVTTSIRVLALFAYRTTAYRSFPLLSVRWKYVRRSRLREVTAFSVFLLIIDVAQKINYTADTMVIGAFMGTAAIATWTVGARLIAAVRTLSNAMGRFLFPSIVDGATRESAERLQLVLIQGTRVSLAMVVPMAVTLALLADIVVNAWVGPRFAGSVIVVRLLAVVVTIRIGTSTAYALLKGAGQHQFAAASSVAIAVANLVLSIILVRPFGLVGIALGTLTPRGYRVHLHPDPEGLPASAIAAHDDDSPCDLAGTLAGRSRRARGARHARGRQHRPRRRSRRLGRRWSRLRGDVPGVCGGRERAAALPASCDGDLQAA
jgi:O-antigen/teichoic acid export membrane protein